MRLTESVVEKMTIGRVFRENTAPINSLDFFHDGELLVASSDDETVRVYNTVGGTMQRVVHSKKYGVDLVRFTHHNNAVVCASKNNFDQSIRYLSLHDNTYLRYYKGHKDRVVSLAMNPKNDSFISGSLDNSVRLWDLRSNNCQGIMNVKGRPSVCYDSQGLVFSAAGPVNTIKLFDVRFYDKGPFSSFVVEYQRPLGLTCIKFSPDGKLLAALSSINAIFVLDAFSGEKRFVFTDFVNSRGELSEISFSPDGQLVMTGSEDGRVHLWSVVSGREIAVWRGNAGPTRTVQWNPKFLMAASGCCQLAFWIAPDGEQNL